MTTFDDNFKKAIIAAKKVAVDPVLCTTRRKFGVAGGPDEIVLTDEGLARAFSVGAQVRRGPPADALEALGLSQGEGHLSVRASGAKIRRTALGRFDQIAWGHLRQLGYVESFQDDEGDGIRLTVTGKTAIQRGVEERNYLLKRCQGAS
jgi:hypothetical protein